ncbi:MAG: cell wall hydrolase [Proteobacteria bacterium]|nr:cell wall hydrolase [Pseudomonadota bacterium]
MNKPHFSEKGIFSRTLYGEARGEVKKHGQKALEAIGHVILNRFLSKSWFGKSIDDVCLKPYQFSCWNREDPNYSLLMQPNILDGIYLRCERIAHLFLTHIDFKREDFTNGSNHYHHKLINPHWAKDQTPVYAIGNHIFYKL